MRETKMNQNNNGSDRSGDDSGCATSEISSRRRFLQQATTYTLGALSLTVLGGATPEVEVPSKDSPVTDGQTPLYGFLVDGDRCVGAGKCLTACRIENDVPEGNSRTWVERYVHFKDGRVQVDLVPETGYVNTDDTSIENDDVERAYFVPKLCNHCRDAPCNQVCPTRASITSPEGFELIDPDLCIGCAYCVQACPYGVRFINQDKGIADKCTWCYHRVMRDEEPACVEACPTGARVFGRLDDPNSEISRRIAQVPTSVLKEHLGTHPKLYYLGLSREVI